MNPVAAILPKLRLWDGWTVFDPAFRKGQILAAVAKYARHKEISIDLRGCDHDVESMSAAVEALKRVETIARLEIRDAFEDDPWTKPRASLVIGHPPRLKWATFVERSLRECRSDGEVAMFIPIAWLANKKRFSFHRRRPADVYIVPGNSSCWMVWGPNRGGRWEVLEP